MSGLPAAHAFSLIEILAAMSVFAIVGLLTVSILTATNRTVGLSSKAIGATEQARWAFDLLGMDLRRSLRRSDMPFEASEPGSGGDMLRFASLVASAGAGGNGRDLSILAYRIAPHGDNGNRNCLVRGARALTWSDTGFFGLQSDGQPLIAFPADKVPVYSGDYDVLAPGVIRMVVGYQLYPDNQVVTLADGTIINQAQGQLVYSPPVRLSTTPTGGSTVNALDVSRISALVVGLVALDLKSLERGTTAQIEALATAFPLPEDGELPVRAWAPTANDPDRMPSSVPLNIRQAVRVFERVFPLTPFTTREAI